VHVSGDLHILGLNLIEVGDNEYLPCTLNLRTFGYMSQKLWPNM